jgi:hypothetical protein
VPRLRQAVLVARDLDATVARLQSELGLGEPYRDASVAYFGLVNAVFAVGDTFLEVVSPVDPENPGAATAVRRLERAGRDVAGYMAMVQVDDLAAAREQVRDAAVREVFQIEFDDIAEVHLHPGDMRAIVALTQPAPPESWRWGGEGWRSRSVPGSLTGITVRSPDPDGLSARWTALALGPVPGCTFVSDGDRGDASGIAEIALQLPGRGAVTLPLPVSS